MLICKKAQQLQSKGQYHSAHHVFLKALVADPRNPIILTAFSRFLLLCAKDSVSAPPAPHISPQFCFCPQVSAENVCAAALECSGQQWSEELSNLVGLLSESSQSAVLLRAHAAHLLRTKKDVLNAEKYLLKALHSDGSHR